MNAEFRNALDTASGHLLVDSEREPWMDAVAGVAVGASADDARHHLRIFLERGEIPKQLNDFVKGLNVPFSYSVIGTFELLSGPGDEVIGANSGTVGAIVKKRGATDGKTFILSCAHVLGDRGTTVQVRGAAVGSVSQTIDWINQPIPADAAIASIDCGQNLSFAFPVLPALASAQPVALASHAQVTYTGAASRQRQGRIDHVEGTITCNVAGVRHTFSGVAIVADPSFAKEGDSGGVVIDTLHSQAAGMVFARGSEGGRARVVAICSLQNALDRLGVDLVVGHP